MSHSFSQFIASREGEGLISWGGGAYEQDLTAHLQILGMGKFSCDPATFSMQKFSYNLQYLNCCQILYSNATDLKCGSSTCLFLLYSFLVFTKVLNLRVGRSRDQVLQWAYFNKLHYSKDHKAVSDCIQKVFAFHFRSPQIIRITRNAAGP